MPEEIGPEAEEQLVWLEEALAAEPDRKYMILTHIYAGARVKHESTGEVEDLWQEKYSQRYFDLLRRHQGKVILEVAGHDHWEDLRVY